jgi:hypothetical protein
LKNVGLAKWGYIGIDTWQILADITRGKAVVFFACFRLGYIVLGMDVASY